MVCSFFHNLKNYYRPKTKILKIKTPKNTFLKQLKMLLNVAPDNENGFTLIEIMVVIAIIAILAAIASLQFLNYNRRSCNAAAKSIVHNLRADEGNLKAELGTYGHSEATAHDLTEATDVQGIADAVAVGALRLAATATRSGARLAGTNLGKDYSIGVSLGDNMIADSRGGAQYLICARHYKGDTAYGIDADVENQVFSVSNALWPNTAGIAATLPTTNSDGDDLDGAEGGGLPTTQWMKTQ